MTTTTLSSPRQFEFGNFGRCTEADGEANGTDASIDVELSTGLFVPSSGVCVAQPAEVEAAMNGLQRQLTTMRVPCQAQVDSQLRRAVEALGIMAQENVNSIRQDQWLNAPKVILWRKGWAFVAALKVYAD